MVIRNRAVLITLLVGILPILTPGVSAFGLGINIGDTVRVIANLNVRTGPGTSCPEITDPDYPGYASVGTVGEVLDGPVSANGYYWWKVDFGPGLYTGWSVENGLEKVQSVTLTLYVHEGSASGPIIAGARVTGQDDAGVSFDKTTNSSGYVTITGTPGTWQFTVSKSCYQTNSWSQSITATSTKHAYLIKLVPNPPTPLSPGSSSEPGPVIQTLTPMLQWSSVSCADYYALAVSVYPYGSGNIVYNPQQVYGTSHTVPGGVLEYGKKYRWNMQAYNSAGWSTVSSTLYFQTESINQHPTCSLFANPRSGKAPLTVTFSISASDPDGWISAWVLDVDGDGNADYSGTGNPPSTQEHTYTTEGSYTTILMVSDNDGATASDVETINVGPTNVPPTCSLSANPKSGNAPLEVTFSMSANDSDGSITTWVLDVGEGNSYSGNGEPPSTQTHTYTSQGSYTAVLAVSDNDDATDFATETISVSPPQGTGTLKIESNPGNAEVYIDGEYKGQTPSSGYLTIGDLIAGDHDLRVTKSGYNDWMGVITIPSGGTQYQAVILEPLVMKPDPPTPTWPGSDSEPGPEIETLTPTLEWKAVSNADYYAVAISEYPYGPDYIVYDSQEVHGTSHIVPEGKLEYGKKYRWNMQAYNSAGWSEISNTLYFQTLLPDLQVTDIKPIQTIQDIPLIKDKATMVRVFVDVLPEDIGELRDVMVELEFEGRKYCETANLIRYESKLYVVPDDKLDTFKKAGPYGKKSLVFNYGLDAFNFEDPYKHSSEYPLYPTTEGTTAISAEVDPYDEISESDETNNFMSIEKTVKTFGKNYRVIFRPMSFWGSGDNFSNYDVIEKFAEYQYEYFISTYPIPRSKAEFKLNTSIVPTFGVLSIAEVIALSAGYKIQGYDRVVFIIPEGKLLGYLKFLSETGESPKGLQIRGIETAVFLDETAPQSTMAHEIGHTYGYCEEYDLLPVPGWVTAECGDWDEETYPCGYLAGDGWDVRGKVFAKEDKRVKISFNKEEPDKAEYNYFSFMGSSTNSAWEPDPLGHWAPSNNYEFNKYNTLLDKLEIGTDPRVAVVSGIIHDDDIVELFPLYSYDGTPDTLGPGNYSIECLSDSNEVLSNVSFDTIYYFDTETEEYLSPFVFTIPYPNNTVRILLKHHDSTLKEVVVSPTQPVVNIVSISNLGDETYEIIWDANDPDGDELTYSLSYSHNGEDWFPLVFSSNDLTFNYVLDTSDLPGSDSSLVKIIVTDGINTAQAISESFSVFNKSPSASISRPLNGSIFFRGSDIIFDGWVYDPEEFELDGSSFVWSSSIDGGIGTGTSFTTSKLSVGTHDITLMASDEHNLSDTDTITITVLLKGDLNCDYRIDFNDLGEFVSRWLNVCSEPNWCEGTDLNQSEAVDFVDFSIFADSWLWEKILADFDVDDDVDFVDYAVFADHWADVDCNEPDWCKGADLNKSGETDILDLAIFANYWLENAVP